MPVKLCRGNQQARLIGCRYQSIDYYGGQRQTDRQTASSVEWVGAWSGWRVESVLQPFPVWGRERLGFCNFRLFSSSFSTRSLQQATETESLNTCVCVCSAALQLTDLTDSPSHSLAHSPSHSLTLCPTCDMGDTSSDSTRTRGLNTFCLEKPMRHIIIIIIIIIIVIVISSSSSSRSK